MFAKNRTALADAGALQGVSAFLTWLAFASVDGAVCVFLVAGVFGLMVNIKWHAVNLDKFLDDRGDCGGQALDFAIGKTVTAACWSDLRAETNFISVNIADAGDNMLV